MHALYSLLTVSRVFETWNVKGTGAFRDRLEGANGIQAPSLLASTQPLEATWVNEEIWSQSGTCPGVAGEVECGFNDSRQFGPHGEFHAADRQRTRQSAAASNNLRTTAASGPRKSSNVGATRTQTGALRMELASHQDLLNWANRRSLLSTQALARPQWARQKQLQQRKK